MDDAKQIITALYADRLHAYAAVDSLTEYGIHSSDIEVSPEMSHSGGATGPEAETFWASLERMFGGTEDHHIYAEAVRRGRVMLAASVTDEQLDACIDIVDGHGSLDIDHEETGWRSEGWTGPATSAVARTGATDVASTGVARTDGTLAAAITGTSDLTARSGDVGDVIQVVEERLDVGKRSVSRGKVRLHTYVVERKVSEDVTLHAERVVVERHAVDRPVAALGDDAFRDRVIEMDEFDEEAVVSKTARVVEEIALHRDVTDRTETVHETLRSTKVDVEDGRSAADASIGSRAVPEGSDAGTIATGMEVISSDGTHVGTVGHPAGHDGFTLARIGSATGESQSVPMAWVDHVDGHVHLNRASSDVTSRW